MTLVECYLRVIEARRLQNEWDALCAWSELPDAARVLCRVEAGPQGFYLDVSRLARRGGAGPIAESQDWTLPLGANRWVAAGALETAFQDLFPLLADLQPVTAERRGSVLVRYEGITDSYGGTQ